MWHDLKIYNDSDEKYFILQLGSGKLEVSDETAEVPTTPTMGASQPGTTP